MTCSAYRDTTFSNATHSGTARHIQPDSCFVHGIYVSHAIEIFYSQAANVVNKVLQFLHVVQWDLLSLSCFPAECQAVSAEEAVQPTITCNKITVISCFYIFMDLYILPA